MRTPSILSYKCQLKGILCIVQHAMCHKHLLSYDEQVMSAHAVWPPIWEGITSSLRFLQCNFGMQCEHCSPARIQAQQLPVDQVYHAESFIDLKVLYVSH